MIGRRKAKREAELDEELRAFVDLLTAEKIRAGAAPEEARRAALIEAGGIEQIKENCRDVRPLHWIEGVAKDLRHGARSLLRSPAFTLVCLLVLSLGLGASVTAFSLLNAILFKPLPVHAPEQLVWFSDPSFSYPIYKHVEARGKEVFDGAFAWTIDSANIDWSGGVENAPVLSVTGGFHSVLGVAPAIGRLLAQGDEDSSVAVLSHRAWRERFREDPSVIGSVVRIDRMPFTIVGVAAEGFFGVAPGLAPEITIPVPALARLKPQDQLLTRPHRSWLHMMARLRNGVSRERANAAVQIFWPQIMDEITPQSMPQARRAMFVGRKTELMPGRSGFSRVARRFTRPLTLLLCLAGLLLLAACATIANLLLARATARGRELAVRLAMGATRARLVRQLMTECLLLTGTGALASLLLSNWMGVLLVRMLSTSSQPVAVDLAPDIRVLAFVLLLWIVTISAATIGPVLRAVSLPEGRVLKESRTVGAGPRGSKAVRTLVVAQVALAVLMVSGAALFVHSLARLKMADPGFDHQNVLLVRPEPLLAGYADSRLDRYYRSLQDRLRIAGVESAGLSWAPPVSNDMGAWTQSIGVDGPAPDAPGGRQVFINLVSSGYFETIGQRLLRGRDFSKHDDESSARVCIITESLARTFFPRQDPLGRTISIGRDASRQKLGIVGIVEDAKYRQLRESATMTAYLPYMQVTEFLNSSTLIAEVRTSLPPASLIQPIRRELSAVDPDVLVRFETLSGRIDESLVTERVIASLSGFLGAIALLLATTGLYGLLAFTVSRRTPEIGVRIALGAARSAVQWLVLKDCLWLAIAGVVIGLCAALALARFAAGLLYEISPRDPFALGSACVLMLCVALLAAWLPARRASRVDPMAALRHD